MAEAEDQLAQGGEAVVFCSARVEGDVVLGKCFAEEWGREGADGEGDAGSAGAVGLVRVGGVCVCAEGGTFSCVVDCWRVGEGLEVAEGADGFYCVGLRWVLISGLMGVDVLGDVVAVA